MRYLKFPEVLHDGEIHSLDINKDSTHLLTSGKDCKILVWEVSKLVQLCNLSPEKDVTEDSDVMETRKVVESNKDEVVKNEELAKDNIKEAISKIVPLNSYIYHKSLVNVVRWSPTNPLQFVSSDISGHIYLNELGQDAPTKIFPFKDSAPIIDLSWSQDGKLIAFSTTDSKLHLIDIIQNSYQELSASTEKESVFRSVAFDPTNNYLVALDDETVIYLYQYKYSSTDYQFRLISKISKLINKHSLNVHYKRIDWSPEGELISIPSASKNQNTLISLIAKSNHWQNKLSLVGHGLTCEVVKFNPKIYSIDNTSSSIYNVIATAGSDRSLAVWNTTKPTPIMVLQDLVEKPITDMKWNSSGSTLFLSSLDGFLSIFSFANHELGYEIKSETLQELLKLGNDFVKPLNYKYETDPSVSSGLNSKKGLLHLIDQKDASAISELLKVGTPQVLVEKQDNVLETVSKKGAIVPEIIEAPDTSQVSSSDMLQSAMITRKSKRASATTAQTVTGSSSAASISSPVSAPSVPDYEKQKVTTKNGKRRIQPMLISNTIAPPKVNGIVSTPTSNTKSLMEFEKPSYAVSDEFYKSNKRHKTGEEPPNKKLKRELEPIKFIGSTIVNPSTAMARLRLAIPKTRLSFEISGKSFNDEVFILDVKNGLGNETKPSRITYFRKDKQVWSDFVPRYIQLAAEGSVFWALSTSDGQILTYSHQSGKRLLPPLVLGSPISFLESHSKYLLAVTSIGELFVWDLSLKKIELTANLSPLLDLNNKFQEDGLSKAENITMCAVTSIGIPLITLSNGSGYLFNKDMGTWQTITESWWSFGSHYWDSNAENKAKSSLFGESSIIELLEHKTNEEIVRKTRTGRGKYFNKMSKNMIMKEGFENLENTISLSHLENRLLCCELLGEDKDFHKFFITYMQRICELGFKAKLYEVCDQLLGPKSFAHTSDSNLNGSIDESESDEESIADDSDKSLNVWDPKICGLSKHALLKEVILTCAKNRDVQRVLLHFGKKIGIVV